MYVDLIHTGYILKLLYTEHRTIVRLTRPLRLRTGNGRKQPFHKQQRVISTAYMPEAPFCEFEGRN